MNKLVNIISKVAIRTVTPKICGVHKNVLMSTGDILRCICMRAHVEEILPDGSTVVLNSTNYNKDNNKIDRHIITDDVESKIEYDKISDNVSDTDEENLELINEIDNDIPDENIDDIVKEDECAKSDDNIEAVIKTPHNNSTNHNNGKKNKKKK